jgi:hypothetical protein
MDVKEERFCLGHYLSLYAWHTTRHPLGSMSFMLLFSERIQQFYIPREWREEAVASRTDTHERSDRENRTEN